MKQISAEKAVSFVKDGMTVMIGGFMANGTPEILMDALAESGVKNLTVIANDTGVPGKGIIKLVEARVMKKLIASHIGLTSLTGQLMSEGKLEVELVPQGTLAERIRSGGAGLGGFLTSAGLGTAVAEGKEVIEIDRQKYLLELPLKADIALLRGSIVDEEGNTFYAGTTRNFNPLMAFASEKVIMAAEKIVPVSTIQKESIVTPGILVDYIVGGEAS